MQRFVGVSRGTQGYGVQKGHAGTKGLGFWIADDFRLFRLQGVGLGV